MATSFKKKSLRGRTVYPPGTRVSLHNNQLLVSTGVPALDNLLGGGVAVGSSLLIEEDSYGSYSDLLLKYFLAEGVVVGHSLFVSSAKKQPVDIVKEIPCSTDEEEKDIKSSAEETPVTQNDEMKIAWRYQNLPKVQPMSTYTKFGHYFNLAKAITSEKVDSIKKCFFTPEDEWPSDGMECRMNPLYQKLLSKIADFINTEGFTTSDTRIQAQDRTVLRITLHGLGTPLWAEQKLDIGDSSLPRFLHALKGLLRTSYAVCLVTIPTHLFQSVALTRRVEQMFDTVIALESFSGSDKEANPLYKDYHGLFKIKRLPRLNSLTCNTPESLDLAFKLTRKKFAIEKLHLPPELAENTSRSQEQAILPKLVPSCGTSTKLDF